MILISACLVGINCRYNGSSTLDNRLADLIKEGKAVAACPEILGELPTPRLPCEIVKIYTGEELILNINGENCTKAYLDGAMKTLEICKSLGVNKAILQSRSPSCGCGAIYDGSFKGQLVQGNGLTTRILSDNDIDVYNENNWDCCG